MSEPDPDILCRKSLADNRCFIGYVEENIREIKMNLNSARFYAYVFFKVSPALNRESDPAYEFFKQWKAVYQLEEKPTIHTGEPELKMLRMAEEDAVHISLFRFRDTDIFKFRRQRTEPGESVATLWERSAAEFESRMGNLCESLSFIGTSRIYFAHSSDLSKNAAKMVAKYCQWEVSAEMLSVKVSSLGSLYRIDDQGYLMLSQYGDPTEFLDRDFAVIDSVFQKLEFENKRFQEFRTQSQKSENQIQKLISPADIEEIEKNLTAIRTYQCHLHNSLSLMFRLDQTLDLGMLDINNYLFVYEPQNDTLFVSKIRKVEKIQKQVRFDLNYLRLISDNIDSRVNLLTLTTQGRRLKTERRIEIGLFTFGSAVSAGLMASDVTWGVKLLLIILAALLGGMFSYFQNFERNNSCNTE